ncbi:flagellar export protein FliJ [Ideonella sp. A 288]|uniref:flagellar export protein FliJ n=1 Tax=Ideonella sp. A 288 TaxID=1962181 RepID=UPI001F464CD7|nr:flagellar export protein FliJ [Ideonella sp. A 288]
MSTLDSIATLNTLLQHATHERDTALAALQQAEAAAEAARRQAEQLLGYRVEYRERWGSHFRGSGTIELLHCYQGFAGRLDQAIGQQDQAVKNAEARVERARALCVAREQRVAAVRKLIERRRAELDRAAGRREQRQLDEAAARQGAARSAAFSSQ